MSEVADARPPTPRAWRQHTRRWRRWTPLLTVLGAVVLVALAPVVVGGDPITQHLDTALSPPGHRNWLGTDAYGRDFGARLAAGAARTLALALTIVILGAGSGLAIGSLAGALPRWGRWAVDRLIDIALGLPSLVLALVVVGALGPGERNLVIALTLGVWPWYARLARENADDLGRRDFVLAARVAGIGETRIWATHVLPHVTRRLAVVAALDVGYQIVALAGLSYLGLGAQAPSPEIGVILNEGQDYALDAPWLLWAPAGVVVLLVLPFVLASERIHARGLVR